MRRISIAVAVAAAAGALVSAAHAALVVDAIRLAGDKVRPGHPLAATVDLHATFTSIDSVCIHFAFSPKEALDPGEELRITPDDWLRSDAGARGPGVFNASDEPQLTRTVCLGSSADDPFVAALLDGHENLWLHADSGPVRVRGAQIEVDGTS